jgi:Protein of unknown function DUF2617
MNVLFSRPKVAELVFQLYGKPLHPELFDNLASRQFTCRGAPVTVRITRTGHVISWQNKDIILTEIADVNQDLPPSRRVLSYRMHGERGGSWRLGHGVHYQMSFQVEKMTPEIYLHVHDELLLEGTKGGLLHNFQPNHRLTVAPLGLVSVEARTDCWFLNTFHTFPEEFAVVKSQSLIEVK